MQGTTKNLDKVSAPKELLSKTVSSITSSSQAVRRIIVFGSRARGDNGDESDIDLYVTVQGLRGSRLAACKEISPHLDWLNAFDSLPYDLVVRDDRDFEARAKSFGSLENVVAREGVEIYG